MLFKRTVRLHTKMITAGPFGGERKKRLKGDGWRQDKDGAKRLISFTCNGLLFLLKGDMFISNFHNCFNNVCRKSTSIKLIMINFESPIYG